MSKWMRSTGRSRDVFFATLIHWLGDFDPGEEAVQTAVCRGVGAVATGGSARRGCFPREVQSDRRVAAEGATVVNYGIDGELEASPNPIETDQPEMEDDRLRLIFTCCHPALPPDAPSWRWRCERCAADNRTVEVLGDSPRRLSSPAGRRILRRTHPRKQAEELVDQSRVRMQSGSSTSTDSRTTARLDLRVNSIPDRQALHLLHQRSRRHCHQALAVLFERDLGIAGKASGIRIDRLQEDPDLELGLLIDRSVQRFRLHRIPKSKQPMISRTGRLGGCL